jgi:hypothetical protein
MTDLKKDKQHLLLWSGGFDSSALLLRYVSYPDVYKNARVVGCGLKNAPNYEDDKVARESISKILDLKNRPNVTYIEEEIETTSQSSGTQANVWAWLSSMHIDHSAEDVELNYGYIRHDDFWHFRKEFEGAVKNLVGIDNKHIKITFDYPLEWLLKKDFVEWYLHYPEVFESISWAGDTQTVKARDREDLEFLYKSIRKTFTDFSESKAPSESMQEKDEDVVHTD